MMKQYWQKLWNKLEIRVLVLCSLSIQILLLFLAGYRKRVIFIRYALSTRIYLWGPAGLLFHGFLWLAYLMADYVATVGLAYLRESVDSRTQHLIVFWAPFFLLHLGGQDTITALSIEDNELWSRHLLTLVSQAVLAFYSYFILNRHVGELWPPAVLMFAVGCFKYGERTWALQRASMSALRSSMITKPDPGPNFAKFMQEYTSSKAANLDAKIIIVEERHRDNVRTEDDDADKTKVMSEEEIVLKAYEFFPIFKRLFVDLILSYKNREDSQKYFRTLAANDAYRLIEIELSWMHDMLHSKASVIYTIKYYGWVSRITTLVVTTIVMILFATSNHDGYKPSDVALTYVLLVAAVAMELVAFGYMILSLWTFAVMKESGFWESGFFSKYTVFKGIANSLSSIPLKLRRGEKPKWSDKMAQFSLLTYALEDKPRWWKHVIEAIGLKHTWDNYRYTTIVDVSRDLKDLVCEELKKKMDTIADKDGFRRCTEHRGQWALQRKGYYKEFGWSVEAEFDESILLWHVATDLLFVDDASDLDKSGPRIISQNISNYMMFLLIGRPFMMPAGIGQIRFGDTAAEATTFLESHQDTAGSKEKAVKAIMEVSTEYDPADIKGDRSKSLLFSACKLAHELKDEFPGRQKKRMWTVISMVWVEILCFAASKCSGQYHARQLSKGGELLTVVWFLMAHLGMGEQYRIEQGHARAKLIVSK